MSKHTPGTFEDFMMDKHADQYTGLKDGMVDDCNDWLEGLSVDEWLEFGDKYIKKEGINVELLEVCKFLLPIAINFKHLFMDTHRWKESDGIMLRKTEQVIAKAEGTNG